MTNIWKDGLRSKEMETAHEMLRIGEKNTHNQNNYEDSMKLEPWIFKRMDQDLEETLLRSSNALNDDENPPWIVEILWENEKQIGWSNNENDLKAILEKEYDWWEFILMSNLEKNLGGTPGRLEESGKILEKDLWVRAH